MRPWVIAGGGAEGSPSAAAKARTVVSKGIGALWGLRGLDNRALRPARFAEKRRPGGQVVVPFDQRRRRPEPTDRGRVQRPHGVANRRIVGVDEQRQARIVAVIGAAREMDLAHRGKRKIGEIKLRIEAVIDGADEYVVD